MSLDLFAVLLGGAVYLLPIFAEDILQVGATGFGYLRAAPAVGAFCMAFAMIYLPPMKRAGHALLLAVAGFGVATNLLRLLAELHPFVGDAFSDRSARQHQHGGAPDAHPSC